MQIEWRRGRGEGRDEFLLSFITCLFEKSGSEWSPLHSSNDIMDPKAVEHVKEILHDKNRVWGQIMDQGSQATGLDPEQLAALIGGLISIYLTFGDQARIFANCILIGIPLFIYVFAPQEKPKHELMMIYCACYAVSTTLDPALQGNIPAYYLIKVIAHILLFLRPYSLAEKILAMSQTVNEEKKEGDENDHKLFSKEELKKLFDRKSKSPPPEKPEGEKPKTSTTVSPWPQSSEMKSIEARSPPEHVRTAVSPSVAHQISDKPGGKGWRPNKGRTEMEDSPTPYRLDSSSSNESSGPNAPLDGRGVGAYDIEWEPKDRIVYNAPFDYAHLTYHIRMKNVSRFPTAFAIKSNAIPRVTASPCTGILKPGKSIYIAVTKMDHFDDSVVVKDRIAFEYVRVPEDTQKFDFKLLQFSTLKLRKNIHIKYNP